MSELVKLTKKDFASDQEVRWCPGCGDYAILAAMQKTLAELGRKREESIFISGIGCSSRFPYYMNTYGFHTIHGRAPALATGLKITRPELDVWVITGDGDGLSIGGNHLLHVLRRNVDLQILLFNNEIYGLTKGQYSPTSAVGTISPSSPKGSVATPVLPGRFVMGAGGGFFARGYDVSKKLPELLKAAQAFKGAGFVEILQNCPVFNDEVFEDITARKTAAEKQLWCKHGEPLRFGKDNDKAVYFDKGSFSLKTGTLGVDVEEKDILVHDETNRPLANMLIELDVVKAFGVIYREPQKKGYEVGLNAQVDKPADMEAALEELLRGKHTWTV